MNSNQEVQETAAANTKGPVYLDTVENYVKKQYIEQGIEAACQALDNFLIRFLLTFFSLDFILDASQAIHRRLILTTLPASSKPCLGSVTLVKIS